MPPNGSGCRRRERRTEPPPRPLRSPAGTSAPLVLARAASLAAVIAAIVLTTHPTAAQTGRELPRSRHRTNAGAEEPGRACLGAGGPLDAINESPLRQAFFRPRPASPCALGAPAVAARLAVANQFFDAREGARWAFIDSETYRIDLALTWPLSASRAIHVELPYHARTPGILDGAIDRWHELLGLPRGTRPDYAENRVRLLIGSDAAAGDPAEPELLLAEYDPAAGWGDLALTFVQAIAGGSRSAAAVRAGVELPTGRSRDLFGSGAADVALGLLVTSRLADRLWLHGNFDLVLLGRSPLGRYGLTQSGSLSQLLVGIEWLARPGTRFLVQATSESTPLRVGVPLLDRESLLVVLGLRQAVAPGLEVELGLAEDVRVQTAPDLGLHASLRWSGR